MIDFNKIIVVGDKVLIKPEENLEKTNSGLYLPPGVSEKEIVQGGYVIKVGPGYPIAAPADEESWKGSSSTKYISLQANEGDFALFLKKNSFQIELRNEKFIIISQNAILLLIRDEDLLN